MATRGPIREKRVKLYDVDRNAFAISEGCHEPDLHGGKDDYDISDSRQQPSGIVSEKGRILVPSRHVAAQKRMLRENVDRIKPAQVELPIDEARVNQ